MPKLKVNSPSMILLASIAKSAQPTHTIRVASASGHISVNPISENELKDLLEQVGGLGGLSKDPNIMVTDVSSLGAKVLSMDLKKLEAWCTLFNTQALSNYRMDALAFVSSLLDPTKAFLVMGSDDAELYSLKETVVEVKTSKQASKKTTNFIKKYNLSTEGFAGGNVYQNGKIACFVSYNGRVWSTNAPRADLLGEMVFTPKKVEFI